MAETIETIDVIEENEKNEENTEEEIKEKIEEETEEKITDSGEELEKQLEKQKEDYEILYDKYLRVNAEYENFRKRTAKEKDGIYSGATFDVLINILPVADNMERALKFSDAEKVFEGLKMIHAQFAAALERLGIEEIKSDGEKFDPLIHNAVFHENDDSQPENTVTETLQKGYMKGDKIIRPAMVKVVN